MFESTLPWGAPDLMRVSAFRRYLDDIQPEGDSTSGKLAALSPSLMQDLQRFEGTRGLGEGLEVLEVLAACVRHGCSLLLHLQENGRVLPLTVFPSERLVHCPVPMVQLFESRLTELHVLHVEPALLRPPGHAVPARVGEPEHYAPLGPLLWELALRGAREELLPEIAGSAAYRLAPGAELRALNLSGSLAAAVDRLRRGTTNLREMSAWPGFDRARAMRLLNGLYLQASLMVTRTHPAAISDSWSSGEPR
ncbi:MAG: hypothetical protein ACK5QH_10550 [Rubrivivax sp.]|jgi:hypothetical protein